jgi:hypothetical protein
MEYTVRTSDGRMLAVEETGDPAGKPLLVHMGTPDSRHLYGPNVEDASKRGLRLISYDRPSGQCPWLLGAQSKFGPRRQQIVERPAHLSSQR